MAGGLAIVSLIGWWQKAGVGEVNGELAIALADGRLA